MQRSHGKLKVLSAPVFVLFVLSAACVVTPLHAQSSTPVFDDEFSSGTLDTSKWEIETYAGHDQGTFRADPDYYKPEAIQLSDHMLHIVTERVTNTDPKSGAVYPLRSGRVQTKQAFLYGKFVVRAKMPTGAGFWPAIWLRTPFGQPFNGEIDIMEGHGSHPNIAQSTLHHWTNGKEPYQDCSWLAVQSKPDDAKFHDSSCKRIDSVRLPTHLGADFHTYTMEWTPDRVTWYLDGQRYFEVTKNIPSTPMVVVLSVGFSHNWDGGSADTVKLPQSMDVNYVRIYKNP